MRDVTDINNNEIYYVIVFHSFSSLWKTDQDLTNLFAILDARSLMPIRSVTQCVVDSLSPDQGGIPGEGNEMRF